MTPSSHGNCQRTSAPVDVCAAGWRFIASLSPRSTHFWWSTVRKRGLLKVEKAWGQEMSTGRPGVLQFVGSQRVRHDWATELKTGCQRECHFPVCSAGGASDKRAGGRPPRDGYATGRAHGRAGWPHGLEMLTRVWLRERGASGDPAAHFPRGKDGLSGLILLPMKPWKRLSSSSGWLAAAYSCQLPVNRWHELSVPVCFPKRAVLNFFFFLRPNDNSYTRTLPWAASLCPDLKRAGRLMCAVRQFFAQRFLSTHPAARGPTSALLQTLLLR